MDEAAVREKYALLTRRLIAGNISVTTMESCTSGQIASLITDTEGASAILKGAFITYSNEAKLRQGVSPEVLERCGVYSPETAAEMAETCRRTYGADIGIGVTGSFGNADPNNADSVPGAAYFALATAAGTETYACSIPAQPSRLAYKLYIAGVIADRLLALLSA